MKKKRIFSDVSGSAKTGILLSAVQMRFFAGPAMRIAKFS